MQKQTFQKVELSEENIRLYIDLHIQLKIPFTITISNYTTKIESDRYKLHFMKSVQPIRVFSVFNKLKQELKKPIPLVKPEYIKYYQTGFNHHELYADKIYNIDIKSAYASILFNDELISRETFDSIMSLKKKERLAAVGMIASRKNIFEFDHNGKIAKHDEVINPLANYFFHCVARTYDIMDECKEQLGKHYLWAWVDSVYFTGGGFPAEILQDHLLQKHNLQTSFSELTEFEMQMRGEYYRIRFKKDDEKKFMNIPVPYEVEKNLIIRHLLTRKYES